MTNRPDELTTSRPPTEDMKQLNTDAKSPQTITKSYNTQWTTEFNDRKVISDFIT